MVRACNMAGWDCLAWNYRSCSGEPNKKLRSCHSGATDDLALVIDHAKMALMPGKIDDKNFKKIKNFKDFDDRYTVPINGFKDAFDYWEKCSSKQFIKNISVPTLIVNARDDPCISDSCYPVQEAMENARVFLEIPDSGGHAGFIELNNKHLFWSEKRAVKFFGEN